MENNTEKYIQKNNVQLHSDIFNSINDINTLFKSANCSQVQKYEKSKVWLNRLKSQISEFESSPKLLDSSIEKYITVLAELYIYLYKNEGGSSILTVELAETMYYFSKIRGFKNITQYFPSDVYIIPYLIKVNHYVSNDFEIFVNLIWLSNLALVPFELERISKDLPMDLFNIGVKSLEAHSNGSKNQLAGSILLSRLVTRSDMLTRGFLPFYILQYLKPLWQEPSNVRHQKSLGHLIALNKILKRCDIYNIDEYLEDISDMIDQDVCHLRLIQNGNSKTEINGLNVLYLIKVSSKLTKFYLDSSNYSKVSAFVNLGNEIMNLMSNNFDTKLRFTFAKSLSIICSSLEKKAINYQEQLVIYIIKQLEIENLDVTFSPFEKSTTRYNLFNLDVIIRSDDVFIPKFHTILLFLGFICLNKTLPHHLIPPVLSIVHKMIFFERRFITSILGNQLRDSSCFVLWALSRMMAKEDFKLLLVQNNNMIGTILFDLIKVSIFDRDLVIRRCSIAAIQELIGRYGSIIFENCFDNNIEKVGQFVIEFIELFNNDAIGTTEKSIGIIHNLVTLGFNKGMFISLLLENVTNTNLNFEVRKLNVICLKEVLPMKQDYTINLSISYRVDNEGIEKVLDYFTDPESSFFLSELLSITSKNNKIIEEMTCRLRSTDNYFHSGSPELIEGYIRWMNYLLSQDITVDYLWPNFFVIVKSSQNSDLIDECQQLFKNLSLYSVSLSHEIFDKICYYIRNNNLLLASSVLYYQNYTTSEISCLLDIIDFSDINFEAKSSMIETLNKNLKGMTLEDGHYERIVNLLDDYTITEQGDVGSKIRLATLKLIRNNWDNFRLLKYYIKLKLVRLSGEIIDKIRIEAFNLLIFIDGIDKDFSKPSLSQYYEELFNYFLQYIHNQHEMSLEFWRGVAFSLGTTTASQSLIRTSFIEFVKFLNKVGEECQIQIYSYLLLLLKVPNGSDLKSLDSRSLKVFSVTLNVLLKLFEAGTNFPKNFDYNALFIRSYNLHLNTTNLFRINLVLSIFQYLSSESDVPSTISNRCLKRLIWIGCNHPKAVVRNMVGDILFEILNGCNSENDNSLYLLENIDWDEHPRKLQQHIKSLENIYLDVCAIK